MLDNIKMYLSHFSRNLFFRVQLIRTYTIRLWTNAIVPLPTSRIEVRIGPRNITPYFIDGLQWKVWLMYTLDIVAPTRHKKNISTFFFLTFVYCPCIILGCACVTN